MLTLFVIEFVLSQIPILIFALVDCFFSQYVQLSTKSLTIDFIKTIHVNCVNTKRKTLMCDQQWKH